MIKKDENYAETINAKSQNVDTSSAADFQNANIIKAALKLEAFVTNAATYYFSSIKVNAWILLVILSLNPPPATLQL